MREKCPEKCSFVPWEQSRRHCYTTFSNTTDVLPKVGKSSAYCYFEDKADKRFTPEMLEREPLASLAQRMTAGMGTMIKRRQELGPIRSDLPNELLVAWFPSFDAASDDWFLVHLDQAAIIHVSHQRMAAWQSSTHIFTLCQQRNTFQASMLNLKGNDVCLLI